MQRRTFLKVGGVGLTVAAATPSMLLLEGCPTVDQWIQTVENDIPVIVQIISSITAVIGQATGNGLLATAAAGLVKQSVQTLEAALTAFKDAVDAYKAAKTQSALQGVINALTALQQDVQNVVSTLPIQVPQIATIIVAALGTAVTVLSALQALIPGAGVATAALKVGITAQAVEAKVEFPKPAELRIGYNMVLVAYGYGAHQVK